MRAYFDLENLESFLKQPKNEFHSDCLKLIKKQLDLTFNFEKEKIKESEDLMTFIKIFGDGVGDKIINFSPNKFPDRNLKSNSHKDFNIEQLLSVYFINNDSIDKLRAKDDLLIADLGEEIEMFKLLFLNNDDYRFERKLRIGTEFVNWGNFRNFYTSHMDLIIVDNYILADRNLISSNLSRIVEYSLKDNFRKILNIIIFIKGDKFDLEINELKNILFPIVKAKYTDDPKITVIRHSSEHDRTILRSLLRVYSGDTFNYFSSNGAKITKGKEIHLTSIADKENYKLYLEMLNDLQVTINDSVPSDIIGDKKSRFLNFP